jgi:Ca2+-transporting ATPase
VNAFDVAGITGLTGRDAAERLERYGPNELPTAKARGLAAVVWEVAQEPMFLLLVAAGVVYLALGSLPEAGMLLGFVMVVMGITIYQERKTERALSALRELSSPRALVIRDGEHQRIAGRDVVRGDVMILSEGDRVPADAFVEWSSNLLVDESLLTGESVSVRKTAWNGEDPPARPGGEVLPFVYSGTLVTRGQAIARVYATGSDAEIGKIGRALRETEPEPTLLERETGRLVRNLALIGLVLFMLVVVVYGLTRGNWLEALLAGITLAMAMIPEEFPVILTIFLALGAWRISRERVLTRRVSAIETLGAATVLGVDKTGTITPAPDIPEELHRVVEYAVLASQQEPYDPIDRALVSFANEQLARTEHLHADWTLVREYPLSPALLALSHVWLSPEGEEYVIAAKGAPEAVADLCHLAPGQLREMEAAVRNMAKEGLRVIGVAAASFRRGELPGEQHDFPFEFLGLIGLVDPIRPDAPKALEECRQAGIRVVMITGDYPGTAIHIARQIGLTPADEVLTGPEMAEMDDAQLRERARTTSIFARVVPEQKLRLVNALKANGEVVAMTGDGVNDAPALKAAHIGIAMGGRGTDVARESAALVLLDDDFSSIVHAVRLGRRIFDNLRKAMAYVLSIHVPIAGMSLVPVLAQLPLVLLPAHIAFLELIIDPASSTVFEAEAAEEGIMRRPPRSRAEALFNRRMVLLSVLQGTGVFLVVLAVFAVARYRGLTESEARALTFTTLIFSNLGLIYTNRSWTRTIPALLRTRNTALWTVTGATILALALVLYVPLLRNLFDFAPLGGWEVVLALVAGVLSILWFEVLKVMARAPIQATRERPRRQDLPAR